MRVLAVTSVKNEASFLLEWIAHHRAVGFTDFLIASNDCEDGTDAMLDRLAALGIVTHVPNPGPWKANPQWDALRRASGHPLRKAADWVMVLDVDEFVNIRAGGHRLGDLFTALPDADAVVMTWRLFGNDGIDAIEDRPVTAQFTRAAPRVLAWPWRAAMVKTLFRDDGTHAALGVHRPKRADPARLAAQNWYDGSGRILRGAIKESRPFSDYMQDNHALVQLNHYALGSAQGFVVKSDRGRANRQADPFDLSYWIDRNFSDEEDDSILATEAPRADALAALMDDPELARLHAQGVDWRRDRFARLMGDMRWVEHYARLLMTGSSRALPLPDARRLHRLARAAMRARDA